MLFQIPIDIEGQLSGSEFSQLTDASRYNIPNLTGIAIQLLLIGTAVFSFVFLLAGSFQWVTAGGDKEGIDKARKKITNALIGLALALSVFAFLRIIRYVFNVDILQNIVIPTI